MVVLMHACVTYSGMGSWFYIEKTTQDVASTLVFSIYQSFAQAFFMGLLFFLAGTLVPAAYDRKGFLRFVGDRAVRLGVPSLVFMLILDPLTNIIREVGTGGSVTWGAFLSRLPRLRALGQVPRRLGPAVVRRGPARLLASCTRWCGSSRTSCAAARRGRRRPAPRTIHGPGDQHRRSLRSSRSSP